MNVPLDSRVFSSETLVAGVAMAEAGLGMDQLNDVSCDELQAQLAELEDDIGVGCGCRSCSDSVKQIYGVINEFDFLSYCF